jgi:hypothetical protein
MDLSTTSVCQEASAVSTADSERAASTGLLCVAEIGRSLSEIGFAAGADGHNTTLNKSESES